MCKQHVAVLSRIAFTIFRSALEVVDQDQSDHDDLGPDWQSPNLLGRVVIGVPSTHLNDIVKGLKSAKNT